MTAYDLYHDLTMQGFRLSVNGGNLELVPFSRLTANQCAQIRQYKADLMALIAANDQDHHTKSVVEAQEEADWHEFLYGKSTEELLYNHLLTCPLCHVKAEQYCLYGAELGKAYDALLLRQGDAQTRRESLALQVDRACISGRSVFVSLDHDNLPTPQQKPVKPLTYGIGDSERPFVNHVMACKQCRPRSALYCADGLKLKANA